MKHVLLLFGAILAILANPTTISAQAGSPPPVVINPMVGFSSLDDAFVTLVSVAFYFGALLAFFFIMKGAFSYLTAQDDASKTAAARKTILNAGVGLVLLACVFVIFQLLTNIVPGLDELF